MKHAKICTAYKLCRVAPRAGAGIETMVNADKNLQKASPPARGRELKRNNCTDRNDTIRSPPARGRELKQLYRDMLRGWEMSPPARGRELKLGLLAPA